MKRNDERDRSACSFGPTNYNQVFGHGRDNTLSTTHVFEWHKTFSGEREQIENESDAHRLRTSVTKTNIEAVRNLMEGNRCITLCSSGVINFYMKENPLKI